MKKLIKRKIKEIPIKTLFFLFGPLIVLLEGKQESQHWSDFIAEKLILILFLSSLLFTGFILFSELGAKFLITYVAFYIYFIIFE